MILIKWVLLSCSLGVASCAEIEREGYTFLTMCIAEQDMARLGWFSTKAVVEDVYYIVPIDKDKCQKL